MHLSCTVRSNPTYDLGANFTEMDETVKLNSFCVSYYFI